MLFRTRLIPGCAIVVLILFQLACSSLTPSQLVPTSSALPATPLAPSQTLESTLPVPTSTSVPASTALPAATASATATRVPAATPARLPTLTPTPSVPPTPPFSTVTQLDQWALLMAPSKYSPATATLVFRVKACATCKVNDPKKISDADDGKGIKNVEFVIVKTSVSPPKEVYRRTEGTKFYCAFGGGEPICNVLVFAENPNGWPGKNEPFDGDYTMTITVRPTQGNELERDVSFSIKVKK